MELLSTSNISVRVCAMTSVRRVCMVLQTKDFVQVLHSPSMQLPCTANKSHVEQYCLKPKLKATKKLST
eukprot:22366-Amphidinium_carterae.1